MPAFTDSKTAENEMSSNTQTPPNPEVKTYKGNCHCQHFKFTLTTTLITSLDYCTCTICTQNAYLCSHPVAMSELTVESGEDMFKVLKSYEFGAKKFAHLFCPTCGISIMATKKSGTLGYEEGKPIYLNARILQDLNIDALPKGCYPGADFPAPGYTPVSTFPTLDLASLPDSESLTLYHGACHCGAVTYTVAHPSFSLPTTKVMSCNCSLCSRNGDLWIYPSASHVRMEGQEKLVDYAFVSEDSLHSFCGKCGGSVWYVPWYSILFFYSY